MPARPRRPSAVLRERLRRAPLPVPERHPVRTLPDLKGHLFGAVQPRDRRMLAASILWLLRTK